MIRTLNIFKVALFVSLVYVVGCSESPEDSSTPVQPPTTTPEAAVGPREGNLLQRHRAGESWQDTLHAAYRLKPDQRFLLALAEIDSFFGREGGKTPTVHFTDTVWTLIHNGQKVGTLSEYPDFDEYLDVLTDYARNNGGVTPVTQAATGSYPEVTTLLDDFFAPAQWLALQEIDKHWKSGEHTTELLRLGARAFAELEFQRFDTLEVSDHLSAKAIAHLAIARANGVDNQTREEFMLSWALGYKTHAKRIAKQIPLNTPIAAYALSDGEFLGAKDIPESMKQEWNYLRFRRTLASEGARSDFENFWNWTVKTIFEKDEYVTVYSALVQEAKWVHVSDKALYLLAGILYEMESFGDKNARPVEEVEKVLGGFPERSEQLATAFQGPFATNQAAVGYYEGLYISALHRFGKVHLEQRADIETATQFASVVSGKPDSAIDQYQRWYSSLIEQTRPNGNATDRFANLTTLNHLGTPAIHQLYETGLTRSKYGDPALLAAAKQFFGRVDSRPSTLHTASKVAWTNLNWHALSSRYFTPGNKLNDEDVTWLHSWDLARIRDTETLFAMLADDSNPLSVKRDVLHQMRLTEIGEEVQVQEAYETLLKQYPSSSALMTDYAKYLMDNEKYDPVASQVSQWISRNGNANSVAVANLNARAAKALHKLGRDKEAFELVKAGIDGYVGASMTAGSTALHALGEHKKDLTVAVRGYDRYPSNNFHALKVAEILWLHGNYPEAAGILADANNRMSANFWKTEIAPKFAACFGESSTNIGMLAFRALVTAGIEPIKLHYVPPLIQDEGQSELAIEMASMLINSDRGVYGPGQLHTYAYRVIADAHGSEKALRWMQQQLPAQYRGPASMFFLEENQFDLLWDMYPDINKLPFSDAIWLYRAAGELSNGTVDDDRWREVVDYFESHNGSRYVSIGKHLAGLVSASETEKLINDPKSMAEVGYFMAVRAEYDNRWEDAEDWYRITLESGSTRDREYAWATRALYGFDDRRQAAMHRSERSD